MTNTKTDIKNSTILAEGKELRQEKPLIFRIKFHKIKKIHGYTQPPVFTVSVNTTVKESRT